MTFGVEFYNKTPYTKTDIFPLQEMVFEGYKFFAPGNAHAYLQKAYGDYLKLPPEEERIGHARKIILHA